MGGEKNRPYVCSRYYRAPELIVGNETFTTSVDLWSAGCVMAEMILGQPLFTGKDGISQLVEIIKVLGTPTPQQLRAMNPNYPEYQFNPVVVAHGWEKVFKGVTPREVNELVDLLLRYEPALRSPPLHALMHNCFDSLRRDANNAQHRGLFDFGPEELWFCSVKEREKLIPTWVRNAS